jgi:hypothetical protein
VLANEGADLSAHETLERAQRQADDFSLLAAEYETLAQAAQQQRFDDLLDRPGLDTEHLGQVRQSPSYGPLLAGLRYAESRGLDLEGGLPKLVAARPLDGADDPAAVMHGRVEQWAHTAASGRRTVPNHIAGLIPRALGVSDLDMVRALSEREEAMSHRARELAVLAQETGEAWVTKLGSPPADPVVREMWVAAVSCVAAYRDRWRIGEAHDPLGSDATFTSKEQANHRERAQVAVHAARRLQRTEVREASLSDRLPN